MQNNPKNKINWDLEDINIENIEQYLKHHEEKTYKFINKWKDRDDFLTSDSILKEALDEYELWEKEYSATGSLGYFLSLKTSLDQTDEELKAKYNQMHNYALKIINDIQFFEIKLSKIDKKYQTDFLNSEKLSQYKHFLEQLFIQGKYTLSEPEEKILNLKSKTSYSNWTKMVSEFINKEEREVLDEDDKISTKNFNEIISLISNKDKKIRDKAAEAINDINKNNLEIAVNEINSVLEHKKTSDEIRGYDRPDKSRHIGDDIETEVVDTLIEAVSSMNQISKDYYKLKAKLLGQEKLQYHERNVEIGEIDKKYSYDEAVDLVSKVFKDLDEDFYKIFRKFVEEARIDVFPKKGKRGGAFCSYNRPIDPVYILHNYTDQLNDITTLAHETGHGIHFELGKKQNSLNFSFPVSIAEVASTFMEDFVFDELLKDASDEEKLSLIMSKLNSDISTIFRQIACYKFEQDIHKEFRSSGYLSKKKIGELFSKNMSEYMGEFVEQSEGSENWWVYWSHIRSYFYVYSYASGLLISKSLQNSVKKDRNYIENVKDFLSAANSDSPKKIFEKMGIDISDKKFWLNGLNEVKLLLNEANSLSKKLSKI